MKTVWSDGVTELCLGLHHTAQDAGEDIGALFSSLTATLGDDHNSLAAPDQLHHTLHPISHQTMEPCLPHGAATLEGTEVRRKLSMAGS